MPGLLSRISRHSRRRRSLFTLSRSQISSLIELLALIGTGNYEAANGREEKKVDGFEVIKQYSEYSSPMYGLIVNEGNTLRKVRHLFINSIREYGMPYMYIKLHIVRSSGQFIRHFFKHPVLLVLPTFNNTTFSVRNKNAVPFPRDFYIPNPDAASRLPTPLLVPLP